jgi:hypothetical protein
MWEEISKEELPPGNTARIHSDRLKVPGGWIVRSSIGGYNVGAGISQTFIADPMHEWKLEEEKA